VQILALKKQLNLKRTLGEENNGDGIRASGNTDAHVRIYKANGAVTNFG
jgi:hypothetical protein